MNRPQWQRGLHLDDGPGPAQPLSNLDGARMIERALDEAEAVRPPRRLPWGPAVAAAITLLIVTPAVAAFGLYQLYIAPETTNRAVKPPTEPAPVRPSATQTPPPAVEDRENIVIPKLSPTDSDAASPRTAPSPRPEASSDDNRTAPPPPRSPRRRIRHRSAPRQAAAVARPQTPDQWLTRANDLRAARAFKAAVKAYAEVRRRFPDSGAAYVAAVAEGQLWLSPLDDPRAALAAFEAARSYSDGPLDAEARFGQGEAMHRLGRLRSARRAWRSLIERHPRSAPAKRAQARLESP